MTEQSHEKRNHSRVNDHLNLLVAPVCQVGQSPHRVYQDLNAHTHMQLVTMCSVIGLSESENAGKCM